MSQPFVFHLDLADVQFDRLAREHFVVSPTGRVVTFYFGEEYAAFTISQQRLADPPGEDEIDQMVLDARPDRAALFSIWAEAGETLFLRGFQEWADAAHFDAGHLQRCFVMATNDESGTHFTIVSWPAMVMGQTREIDIDGLLFDHLPALTHIVLAPAESGGRLYFTQERHIHFEPSWKAMRLAGLGANSTQPNGFVSATGPRSPLRRWHGFLVKTHGRAVTLEARVVPRDAWTARLVGGSTTDVVEFDFVPRDAGPLHIFNLDKRRLCSGIAIPDAPLRIRITGFRRGGSMRGRVTPDERYLVEITTSEGLSAPAAPRIRSGYGREFAAAQPELYRLYPGTDQP